MQDDLLVDGNKRSGWPVRAVFHDLSGVGPTKASDDDIVELVTPAVGRFP